jgi:hypothetical protein
MAATDKSSNGHTPHRNGTFPLKTPDVLAAVAAAYGLASRKDLATPGRAGPLGQARRVAYRLLHEECWLSWSAVADVMGLASSGGGSLSQAARTADPDAVAALRAQLRTPTQDQLFR